MGTGPVVVVAGTVDGVSGTVDAVAGPVVVVVGTVVEAGRVVTTAREASLLVGRTVVVGAGAGRASTSTRSPWGKSCRSTRVTAAPAT